MPNGIALMRDQILLVSTGPEYVILLLCEAQRGAWFVEKYGLGATLIGQT